MLSKIVYVYVYQNILYSNIIIIFEIYLLAKIWRKTILLRLDKWSHNYAKKNYVAIKMNTLLLHMISCMSHRYNVEESKSE